MSLRSCCCALILTAATIPATAQIQRQPVPDFKNKTLQQVRSLAVVPGTSRPLFAQIDAQGPAKGVVASQTPTPGAYVIPGEVPLHLTLGNPPPGILQTFLQALANAQNNGQQNVKVPDVTGQNRTLASRTLEAAHLRPSFVGDPNNQAALATRQSPTAGTSVRQGATITVTLALPQIAVPLLVGKTLADGAAALNAASLRIGTVTGPHTDTTTFISLQSPTAGTQVDPGAAVDLTVTAPGVPPPVPQVYVPNLTNLTPSQASGLLANVGLRLGQITGPKGRVAGQQPVPNTPVPSGTSVDVRLVAVPVPPPPPAVGADTGPPAAPDTPSPVSSQPQPQPQPPPPPPPPPHIPTWVIVLVSAGGLVVATAGTAAIVHHFLQPPSTAYSLLTGKPAPKTVIHNQPILNWRLTVRDGHPTAQSVVDRQPAITRRRVQ